LDSKFKNNENFTGWNWVGLVMGGLLVLLGIMSMFLLEVTQGLLCLKESACLILNCLDKATLISSSLIN
jgi:hypothetical protein